MVHGVVYDYGHLTLHQPRQDLQSLHASSSSPNASSSSRSNPNVSAAFFTLALPPTRTVRTSAYPSFLLLPFPLTTPRTWLTALTSLSLANSIDPFPFSIFSVGRPRKIKTSR